MGVERERLIGFGGAIVVHLVLFAILGFGLTARDEPAQRASVKPIIQATAVTEEQVMEPYRNRLAEDQAERQRVADEKRRTEQERIAAAEKKRQAEEAARRKEAELKRQAKLKREAELKRKQEAEKARLAELERKRKIEAERKAEEARKQAEAKRKAEEARKRKAEEERKRREAEERLRNQMAAEEARLAKEAQARRSARLSTLQQQYLSDIANKVERNWLRPPGSQGRQCRVLINQLPGGDVVGVQVTGCDGDLSFQRSVEAAVRKASPLPPAPEPELFDREIEFIFKP